LSKKGSKWSHYIETENRDWLKIFSNHSSELRDYIAQLVIESRDNRSARSELDEIRSIFSWREEYFVVCEIKGTDRIEFGSIKCQSLDSMMDALSSSEIFAEDAQSFLDPGVVKNFPACDWGEYKSPSVHIQDLRLR
jgi:hypothetical protein